MKIEDLETPGLVTIVAGAVVGLVKWVGGLIQQNRLDLLEERARLVVENGELQKDLDTERAEKKALELALREALINSSVLLEKCRRLQGKNSDPPTT